MKKSLNILYFSSWKPNPCGVAIFALNMAEAIQKENPKINWKVIVPSPSGKKYRYPKEVIRKIRKENLKDYKEAAEFCNKSSFDLVIVQHEFGLYGGNCGEYLLTFLKNLKKPAIGIMHTIPDPKDEMYKRRKKNIALLKKSHPLFKKLIVFCGTGKKRLEKLCAVPSSKIEIIPHGSILFPQISSLKTKKKLGFENNILILTFGFISPRKGNGMLLKAFSQILSQYPKAKLVFLGGGHPAKKTVYKEYLKQIRKLIKKLKIEKNVIMFNKFVSELLIKDYFKAADIYVSTHPYKSQISSGPLTFALGAGKAIVSTDFDYAKDMLKNGRGILFPIGNDAMLAQAILKILDNPNLKKELERKSASFGKKLIWDKVALKYTKVIKKVCSGK